jgi:hypothetical protein
MACDSQNNQRLCEQFWRKKKKTKEKKKENKKMRKIKRKMRNENINKIACTSTTERIAEAQVHHTYTRLHQHHIPQKGSLRAAKAIRAFSRLASNASFLAVLRTNFATF